MRFAANVTCYKVICSKNSCAGHKKCIISSIMHNNAPRKHFISIPYNTNASLWNCK